MRASWRGYRSGWELRRLREAAAVQAPALGRLVAAASLSGDGWRWRRWALAHRTVARAQVIGAPPQLRSCAGLASAAPPPPPQAPPEQAPAAAAGAEQEAREEGVAIDAIQDFVETLLKIDQQALTRSVFEAVDGEFRALVRSRDQEQTAKRAKLAEARKQRFLDKVELLLHRRLSGTIHDGDRAMLLERLQPCHAQIDTFHNALWRAAYDSDRPISAVDSAPISAPAAAALKSSQQRTGPTHVESMWRAASESRPLFRRPALDALVESWTPPPLAAPPSADRSIVLSNLPPDATEEAVRGALAPCGPVRSVELCPEWLEDLQPELSVGDEEPPEYSPLYAIVEFEDREGRDRACMDAPRVFGVLFKEVRVRVQKSRDPEVKPKTKKKVVTRPAYPQNVQLKRTLLLQGLPWSLEPWKLLAGCARALTAADRGRCVFRALNSAALGGRGALVGPLRVEVDGDEVRQAPDQTVLPGSGLGVTNLVLRFQSFEQAYAGRQLLGGLQLGGRQVRCGFPPWRPSCRERDSSGQPLPEPVLVDLPLDGRGARYNCPSDDPLRLFGVPAALAAGH